MVYKKNGHIEVIFDKLPRPDSLNRINISSDVVIIPTYLQQ